MNISQREINRLPHSYRNTFRTINKNCQMCKSAIVKDIGKFYDLKK